MGETKKRMEKKYGLAIASNLRVYEFIKWD